MSEALAAGLLLGLAAGVAPGPMLALTLTQSLRYGPRAGLRVAAAPLLTDLPIIALTLLVLIGRAVLGTIALIGAVYVGFLAWETWRGSPAQLEVPAGEAGSLRKAMLTNFFNPHPYLFWVAAGGPFVLSALHGAGVWAAAGFIAAFYLMLIGAKAALALLVGRHRGLLRGRAYVYTLRILALGLAALALILLSDGLQLLGLRG